MLIALQVFVVGLSKSIWLYIFTLPPIVNKYPAIILEPTPIPTFVPLSKIWEFANVVVAENLGRAFN